jgi:hypothetical protein
LVEAGAAAFFFLLFGFIVVVYAVAVPAAGVSAAAIGAADLGCSAAVPAATRPNVNKAAVIRVTDLVMRSPISYVMAVM